MASPRPPDLSTLNGLVHAALRPRLVFGVLALVLVFLTVATPYRNSPAIRSDGNGYHAWTWFWLRGVSFCDAAGLAESQALTYRSPDGTQCTNKYPPGVALLRLPAMLPVVCLYDPTGPTPYEHFTVLALGALLAFATWWLMWRSMLDLGVSADRAMQMTLFAGLGGLLLHYGTYDAGFSHIYSAFGFALLMFLGARVHTQRMDFREAAPLLGMVAGWLLLVRSISVVPSAMCVGWLAWSQGVFSVGRVRVLGRVLIPVVMAGVVQLVMGVWAAGTWVVDPYRGERFVWSEPHHLDILASMERGILNYTPIILVTLLAVVLTGGRAARFPSLILAPYWFLYGFWHSWHLGGGFGHRGFVDLMPPFFVTAAVALKDVRPARWNLFAAAGSLATLVTLVLMRGYWLNRIPHDGTTAQQYWSALLPF